MSNSDSDKLLLYRFVDGESNRGVFRYLQYIDSDYLLDDYIRKIVRWHSNNVIATRTIIKNLGIDYLNVRHYFKSTSKSALYQMYKLKRYINKKYKNKNKITTILLVVDLNDKNIVYQDEHQVVLKVK